MTVQLSVAVRNARLDAIETAIGVTPIVEIRSGAPPASCAAADTGTVLATLTLPSDWLGAAAAGVKALAGIWEDLSADASGTAGHFRVKDSTGTTTHMQGTAGEAGTDMILNNAVFAAGQPFEILSFALTDGNA